MKITCCDKCLADSGTMRKAKYRTKHVASGVSLVMCPEHKEIPRTMKEPRDWLEMVMKAADAARDAEGSNG